MNQFMDSVLTILSNFHIVDFCIFGFGALGFYMCGERFKALYKDYPLNADHFTKEILQNIQSKKVEKAIELCNQNDKKPLAFVIKRILERSDRDDEALYHSFEIASNEVGPRLTKSLGHLSMIANVVTMVGLLGTVTGLIVAFRAISFADVSQKHILLSQGISIAMSATAFGLMFAIPIMFFYSFLHSKQSQLFSDIDTSAHKVIEALEDRIYQEQNHTAYPDNPQKNNQKVS